jgi:hypothetical protein
MFPRMVRGDFDDEKRSLDLVIIYRTENRKTGGAKGIRTPDLLHAMHPGFV